MRRFLMFLCAMTLVLVMVGSASATPCMYSDTFTYGQEMSGSIFGTDDTVSWTFDITRDPSNPFNPDTQDISSASVALNLRDDGGFLDFWEFAGLDVGCNNFRWEVNTGDIRFTITSLMTLSDTGMVAAELTAICGDFYFNRAILSAQGTAPVPEPASMLLMGAGLLSLGVFRKRLKRT